MIYFHVASACGHMTYLNPAHSPRTLQPRWQTPPSCVMIASEDSNKALLMVGMRVPAQALYSGLDTCQGSTLAPNHPAIRNARLQWFIVTAESWPSGEYEGNTMTNHAVGPVYYTGLHGNGFSSYLGQQPWMGPLEPLC